MKLLIGIIVLIVLVGGLVWFFSSPSAIDSSNNENQPNTDTLSENGRVLDTDDKVFEEIEDALTGLE